MANITALQVQERLVALGYDIGPDGADGVFGKNTQTALIRFQTNHGLPPTGQPDVATAAKLFPIPTRKAFPMDQVIANVKSAWLSKLNWTLAAGVLFNIFAFLGLQVPTDVKEAIVAAGNAVVLILAWVIKTWFTTSITPAAAKKLPDAN